MLALLAIGLGLQNASAQDKMEYASKAASKFANFPGLPKCLVVSANMEIQ